MSKTRHRKQTKHRNGRKPKGGRKLNPTQKSAIARTELGAAVASAPESVLSRPQVKSAAVSRRTFLNLLTGLPLIGRVLGLGTSIASFAFLSRQDFCVARRAASITAALTRVTWV